MSRDELWRDLAEAGDALQEPAEAFKREPTIQARAAFKAACHSYVQRLAPVIGEAAAFRYEASLHVFTDAVARLTATTASLAGLPSLDDTDRTLVTRLNDEIATARRALDAAEVDLHGALDRVRAHDDERGREDPES